MKEKNQGVLEGATAFDFTLEISFGGELGIRNKTPMSARHHPCSVGMQSAAQVATGTLWEAPRAYVLKHRSSTCPHAARRRA